MGLQLFHKKPIAQNGRRRGDHMGSSKPGPAALKRIQEDFGQVWPVHLSGFTDLLVRLRAEFDGDLDLMLVLAVIADRTRPDRWTPELLTYRQLTQGEVGGHHQHPINLHSVAEFTGIPRETVRRKVALLTAKGWVDRHPDGSLTVGRRAATDLEAATTHSIAYLAALLAVLEPRQDG
jgi:hypothetical protein